MTTTERPDTSTDWKRLVVPLPLATSVARDGPFGLAPGLAILESLLERLAGLHRSGIAYGELDPETILGGPGTNGEPGVTLDPPAGRRPPPAYLAPELRGGPSPGATMATKEADVWAAGAIAFLLFSGRPPAAYPVDEEPLALVAPGVPLRLGALVDRMLASLPGLRPSASGAAEELRALRAIVGPAASPEVSEAPAEKAAPASSGGWLGGWFRKKASPPSTVRNGPTVPKSRTAANPSLALLGLEDVEPIERRPLPPPPPDRLQFALQAILPEAVRGDELPSFPAVALEVVELSKREDIGANELVRLINRDPGLTARVLRIANSVYANRGVEVTSSRDAVTRLGLIEVAQIAAAAATRALFLHDAIETIPAAAEFSRRIWLHSLTSALAASWLAMECRIDSQRAFLGGMLHDIGKMVALRGYAQLVAAGRLPALEAETLLGPLLAAAHVDLGVRTARAWSLPATVIRTCAEHHRPEAGSDECPEVHLVRVVSGLASLRIDPDWSLDRLFEIQESAIVLGLDRLRIRATAAQVRGFQARAELLAKAAS